MNQQELDQAVVLHQIFLHGDIQKGSRLNLSRLKIFNRDISCSNLSNVDLSHSDLSHFDLSNSNFSHSDLSHANISHSDLSQCNLTNTKGLPKAPHIDNIDRKLLAILQDKNNELYMGNWHLCKTTHCRGGWYINLAGEEGIELAKEQGNAAAASLIFHESYPDKIIPDWYCSDEEAMEDIESNA